MRKILIIPVILILIGVFLLVPVSSASPVQTPDSSVTLSGHVLPNGDLALFYYSSPSGVKVIHSDTVIPVNNISLDLYSLDAQNLTISVAQFSGYYVHNVTTRINNNSTITTPEKSMVNPVYSNETITTEHRQLAVYSINIPTTHAVKNVSISIDNSTYLMEHKTSPNIIPHYFSGLGQLGIALGYLLMGVVVFFIGTLTADLLLIKMKYWPPFGKIGWFVILFFLLISMGLIVLTDYYQIAYITWYYWLIPFYIFATLAMLEIWPQKWESLLLETFKPKTSSNRMAVHFPRVTRSKGEYEYLRDGHLAALKRIFFHIPVYFYGSQWKGENEATNPEEKRAFVEGIPISSEKYDLTSGYILRDEPRLEYAAPVERKHFRKKRGKVMGYMIPLMALKQEDEYELMAQMKAVGQFSDENEVLRNENRDLRISVDNGRVRYNNTELNEISKKLYGSYLEFHPGIPEPGKDKEEKKEDQYDRKENRSGSSSRIHFPGRNPDEPDK